MQQPHFRREFGGYSAKEVDDFLQKLDDENSEKIKRQNDEMFRMRQEIYNLNETIELYKTNEDKMKRALDETIKKDNELSNLSHNVYDLEVQRMRLLYNQWSVMIEKMKQKLGNAISNQDFENLVGEFSNSLSVTINSQVQEDANKFFAKTQVTTVSNQNVENENITHTHEEAVSVSVTEDGATVEKIVKHTIQPGASLVDKFLMGEDVEMPKSYGEIGPNLISIPLDKKPV